jgi:hypothetical protein
LILKLCRAETRNTNPRVTAYHRFGVADTSSHLGKVVVMLKVSAVVISRGIPISFHPLFDVGDPTRFG